MSEDYGIRSVPPRYDEYNSYFIHTSEGYEKAVEQIEAEEREQSAAEIQRAMEADLRTREEKELSDEQRLVSEITAEEEMRKSEEYHRQREQAILDDIRLKEEEVAAQKAEISEYEDREEDPPGTRVDLLA
ncbi:hypothetical protein [Spirochaeta isovalerica]|uniref:Putative membrane protein YqiK n=1 Tax=Spirochaeta isovalerica TaxID=150 RepID=A0A841REL5_9SPIO|nr:hypothetical protein [Spirochaeta isovalerica]MBB6481279.1 putative membrane protein YqiK [Spirochaeta isovalerica]